MICIIQARLGSRRLAKKMLMKINNESMIEWVINRCKKIKNVDKILLALPDDKKQKELVNIGKRLNCEIFFGSNTNLINRYYDALKKYKQKQFIRVCADNPFLCSEEIDHLINFFYKKKLDYAYNHAPIRNSYPDGLGAEISTLKTLKKIKKYAKTKSEKEHIFQYLWNNEEKFKISTLEPKDKYYCKPFLKLDIDYKQQLNFFKKIKIDSSMKSKKIIKKIMKYNV